LDNIELGKIIAELRKQTRTENGKSWTRKELGEYLHLTTHQVGRLERGERKYLDMGTLRLLADAFKLTPLERKELLFAAASAMKEHPQQSKQADSKSALNHLIETLSKMQNPAFILDEYADIVAANSQILILYRVNPEFISKGGKTPAGYNLLKFIYSSESGYKTAVGASWEKLAKRNIHFFRRVSLRKRHKPYFKKILNELHKEKEFGVHWHAMHIAPQHYDSIYDTLKWDDPHYGPVEVILIESAIPTYSGNLYLFTYIPADQKTTLLFNETAKTISGGAFQYAPWPEKPWQ